MLTVLMGYSMVFFSIFFDGLFDDIFDGIFGWQVQMVYTMASMQWCLPDGRITYDL